MVLLRLPEGHDAHELAAVMAGLSALRERVEGFQGFEHGPNRDVEGKLPDHPYGFLATFEDAEALADYADHPDHRALGARLVALCGGAEGILVADFDV